MQKKTILLILLIIISIVPLLDLLRPGLPVTHDGQDHVARIANFYKNLTEGNIIPRWAGNLNWGYGHPILMFLYPLPSYTVSLFHFFGLSIVDGMKLFFAIMFVASGVAMYVWVSSFLSKEAAFVAGFLYIFAPYRFVDLYVRGAIGEHAAFVFPPLVMLFLYLLSKKNSYWYIVGGSLSFAGLLLSHNAISLMFLPLFALYTCFLLFQARNKHSLVIQYAIVFATGIFLASFFVIPAFLEGKYTLRDIVTKGEYVKRFVSFGSFFYGPWNYGGSGFFTVQVGILQWFSVLLTPPVVYFYRKQKNRLWLLGAGCMLIFCSVLLLMTEYASFIWHAVTVLQKFQFPWRFLSVIVFITAFLGAFVTDRIPKRYAVYVVVVTAFLGMWFSKDYWYAKAYVQKEENFYSGIYHGTTDTGESAPIWSVRFMEKPWRTEMEVIEGKAKVIKQERTSTLHAYRVTAQEASRLRENTLFFPGWRVYVNNKQVPLQFQDPTNRGLITFKVEPGENNIRVVFGETKLRLISNALSAFGGLVLIGLFFVYRSKYIREKVILMKL